MNKNDNKANKNRTNNINNNKTNNTKNNRANTTGIAESITGNPYVIAIIIAMALAFFIYVVYHNYSKTDGLMNGRTYYGKDLSNYEPLFKLETDDDDECIKRCKGDPMCDGVTIDIEKELCTGTKDGEIRADSADYKAWVKPVRDKSKDKFKTLLVGMVGPDEAITIKDIEITKPYFFSQFMYLSNITINDWYTGFKYWKHVWHKGTDISDDDRINNLLQWDEVEQSVPEQLPGLWLAPYTNNLRVAFTISYDKQGSQGSHETEHAFKQVCDGLNCRITDTNTGTRHGEMSHNAHYHGNYSKSEGECRDDQGGQPNWDIYNLGFEECKNMCEDDDLCQGFTLHKHRKKCTIHGQSQTSHKNSKSGTIISRGTKLTPQSTNYTCYTKNNYIDQSKRDTSSDKLQYIDIQNVPVNEPFHIAVSFNDTNVEIYLNGKLAKTELINGHIVDNHGPLQIKSRGSNDSGGFNGSVSHLYYYPLKADAEEAKRTYYESN